MLAGEEGMTACITIPYWVLAIAGIGLIAVSAYCYNVVRGESPDECHMLHLVCMGFTAPLGITALLFGIVPYLPCVSMVI